MTSEVTRDVSTGGTGGPGSDAGVEPVAVIGLAVRVPGAADTAQFWRNLVDGTESIRALTRDEQLAAGATEDDLADPGWVSAAPVLDDLEGFDAALFGMTPREAQLADPQHRIFLEESHAALEDAGYDPGRFPGAVGVYVGTGHSRYEWLNLRTNRSVWAGDAGQLSVTAVNSPDHVATQVSYRLNLRGPSMTVHTACSTSLVALHLACEALRNGECDMALAGGVSVELPHRVGYRGMDGFLSPDGHCRPFDAQAAGTLWGSGAGVVLVKRLADAVADGDHIRAVIRGNAVNNDGADKVGFSAPSVAGQAAVVTQALDVAGVDPRTVTYVEAHGTGTALGDPIEVSALTSVYSTGSTDRQWCAIGSVKSNLGHLSHAAGIVGLAKVVLALEHGMVPPTLHVEQPNPAIDFDRSPFYVATTLSKFDSSTGPRRAAVSSFGVGGTNAHLVLEQAPPGGAPAPPAPPALRPAEPAWPPELLQLSAHTSTALATMADQLAQRLSADPELSLRDVAHTLRVGRVPRPHRAVVVATDTADAAAALRDPDRRRTGEAPGTPPRVAFLFPGQGSQSPGTGARLYHTEPVFAAAVDECLAHLGEQWRPVLFDPDRTDVHETRCTQPALFVLEYALARWWESRGVRPAAMVGHSVGEYVAATLAGVFPLPDALRLVAARGELMQSMPAGSMLAVAAPEAEVADRLPDGVVVAAVNSPDTTVVSGPTPAVEELAGRLADAGVGARLLRTSHAFHSPMMDPIVAQFAERVAAAERHAPVQPFWSDVTGEPITPEQATDPAYWARHLREPVRFDDCLASVLAQDGDWLPLECGPGSQLTGLARRRTAGGYPPQPGIDPRASADEVTTLYATAGQLWSYGVPVTVPSPSGALRVPLPTYPFERERHWSDPDPGPDRPAEGTGSGAAGAATGPLPVPDRYAVPVWRQLPPPPGREPLTQCHVVVAGQRGRELVAALRADGVAVTELAPGQEADAAAAERIVHAAALDGTPPGADPGAADAAQEHGFLSALALVRALAERERPVRVDLVSCETEDPVPGGLRQPEHATLAGIARVAPLEVGALTVRRIDVGGDTPDVALIGELRAPVDGPAEVALRSGRRWRLGHEQVRLPEAEPPLRRGGRYLVTGGLGGIGLTIAEDLAGRTGGELVLTSRTGLSPRAEWDSRMAEGTGSRTGRAIAAVRRMEQAGATVHVAAVDVTDVDALRRLRDGGPAAGLNGIVHAAGVPGGGMLAVRERSDAAAVLAPKLRGTLALHAAFGDAPLDFVVLCSSTTALSGGVGQADYCAANAFLDAYARSTHGWSARVVSVNWGGWSQVGMAAETTAPAALRGAAAADEAIHPADGARALRDLLAGDLGPQVAVSALPVDTLLARARERTAASLAASSPAVAPVDDHPPGDAPAAEGPRDALEAELVGIWRHVLGVDEIGVTDDFFALGGNSLVAVQLVAQVRSAVRVKLPMRTLFEHPTVAGMAAQVTALRAESTRTGERSIPRLRRSAADDAGSGREAEVDDG